MAAKADFETSDGAGGAEVRFTGRLTLARLGDLPARLDALGPIAALDLSGVERIDTVGAWIVTRTANAHDARISGASEEAQRLLQALADDKSEYLVPRDRRPMWPRMLAHLGPARPGVWHELLGHVDFFGAVLLPPFLQPET